MHHHDNLLARAVSRHSAVRGTIAIILTGSVARGTERVDSDVDLVIAVTPRRFHAARAGHATSFVEHSDDGVGYVDVKLTTLAALRRARVVGDEPTRAAFADARVVWGRSSAVRAGVAALLEHVTRPPADYWRRAQSSAIAGARLYGGYFLEQGERLDNPLLLHHAATHLAIAVGRAMLARDGILYAGPKYLAAALDAAPSTPPRLSEALERLVTRPSAVRGREVLELVEALGDWPLRSDDTLAVFVAEYENSWLTGRLPPEYR